MGPDEPQNNNVIVSVTGVTATGSAGSVGVAIHSTLPAEHPFYANVGRVASEWSHIEHILDTIIWELLPVDPVMAACVTTQIMGVGPRCNVIDTLGKVRSIPDEVLKPVRKLKSDSYSTADWRNRFVHDPWYFEAISQTPAQFRAMPVVDPKFGFQEITQDQIDKTIGEIRVLQDRAMSAKEGIKIALSELP